MKKNSILRSIAVIMVLVVVMISAVACGGKSESSNETTADTNVADEVGSSTAEETKTNSADETGDSKGKVAYLAGHLTNEFTLQMADNAEQAAEECGYELVVFNGDWDLNTHLSQIENACAQGYVAIILDSIATEGYEGVLDSVVAEANIPFICVSSPINGAYTSHVGCDFTTAAKLNMEACAEFLDGSGNIAILAGTDGVLITEQEYEGYESVLEQYPDINIVFEGTADFSADKATNLVENWISSGKEIDGIVSMNDGMALGARSVLVANDLDGEVFLCGLDCTSEAREAIRQGEMQCSILVDSLAYMRSSFDIIEKFYAGEDYSQEVSIEPILITAENIDEYFPED